VPHKGGLETFPSAGIYFFFALPASPDPLVVRNFGSTVQEMF
jgi:hypothetical protein